MSRSRLADLVSEIARFQRERGRSPRIRELSIPRATAYRHVADGSLSRGASGHVRVTSLGLIRARNH